MNKVGYKEKIVLLIIISFQVFGARFSSAQTIKMNTENFQAVQVGMSLDKLDGKTVIKVIKDSTVVAVDQPTFIKLNNLVFKNGIIEVKVLSRLLKNAKKDNRGFIGVAFRINDLNSKFECIYIRPTNGRADDQIRRNHSIQYFAYPDYPYTRLRKENPEQYETHADMGLNEWTQLRIVVKDNKASLFMDNNKYATLVVNDLKHGPDASGAIGLWVDVGTEGFFKDLHVMHSK